MYGPRRWDDPPIRNGRHENLTPFLSKAFRDLTEISRGEEGGEETVAGGSQLFETQQMEGSSNMVR